MMENILFILFSIQRLGKQMLWLFAGCLVTLFLALCLCSLFICFSQFSFFLSLSLSSLPPSPLPN